MPTEWQPIPIPKELIKEIEQILKDKPFWTSPSDFIRDAIREKLSKCVVQADVLIEDSKEAKV